MTDKESQLGKLLSGIANELNITDTMYDKAVESYTAVGKWIGEGLDFTVEIMPQGSMNLGTTIRPINEEDDYDIDLVCLLKEGSNLAAYDIKNLVGSRLKEHGTYSQKLNEGHRCWTMNYAGFHMDILPCVPKNKYFIKDLSTEIRLTHKWDDGYYTDKYSNPYGYGQWFVDRMAEVYKSCREDYAAANMTVIDRVPTYKVHTPLQQSIQLLKRHRDIMFGNNENAPISIIITTLAAESYNNELNLFDALNHILDNMIYHIENRNEVLWVPNPVMPAENFADKWQMHPERKTAFYSWVRKAKSDLLTDPIGMFGIDIIGDHYKQVLGDLPVTRALNNLGDNTRTARNNGTLYVNGLAGGLSTIRTDSSTKIKEHTFFG